MVRGRRRHVKIPAAFILDFLSLAVPWPAEIIAASRDPYVFPFPAGAVARR